MKNKSFGIPENENRMFDVEVEKLKLEIVRIQNVLFYIQYFLNYKPKVNGPVDSVAEYVLFDKEYWTLELNKKRTQLKNIQ